MKKLSFVLMAILMPLMISAANAVEINGIYYNLSVSDLSATVTSSPSTSKYMGYIVIPKTVSDGNRQYSVTSIGSGAFSDCPDLISVTIPLGVKSIGGNAFSSCPCLISVAIPNTVTTIGDNAFWGCTSLLSINIPASVSSIGKRVLKGCSGLTSITVDASNKHYNSTYNCNAIIRTYDNTLIAGCQNTLIPYTVTTINDYAFSGCTGLTSITIPNSVTFIGSNAFFP